MSLRFGLVKTSLIDYPGKVSAVVFTHGCNFCCPYCHNPELVLGSPPDDFIDEEELMAFLERRKTVLGGVVITGGEPLIHPEIPSLSRRIRSLGLSIKIDTNGSFPERLKECEADFVALDLKTAFPRYKLLLASRSDAGKIANSIRASLRYLKETDIPYQLRTTMVPGIVGPEDLRELLKDLNGCRGRYLLSGFRNTETLDPAYGAVRAYGDEELYSSAEILENAGIQTQIRLNR